MKTELFMRLFGRHFVEINTLGIRIQYINGAKPPQMTCYSGHEIASFLGQDLNITKG